MTTTQTSTAPQFSLTDTTTGKTWAYETEPQLKTVTTLYSRQHPKHGIAVVIRGQRHVLRLAR